MAESFRSSRDHAPRGFPREYDVLLFWSLGRLTREGALKTLDYLERLTAYGVGYRSFTEQYLDSCGIFRDGVIAILATIAKQERVRHIQRVKAGMDHVKQTGQTKSGEGKSKARSEQS